MHVFPLLVVPLCLPSSSFPISSAGMVDVAGVQSVKNAVAAGFTDVSIYIFPSVNAVERKSPAEQVKEMVTAFEGTSYNRIWLDVEVLCASAL